jgi:anti-anti-sigma factor
MPPASPEYPFPSIEVTLRNGVVFVALVGEHDLSNVRALERTLADLVAQGLPVVVDLAPTQFLDLAVIRVLLRTDRALRLVGGRLALCMGTGTSVHRLLEVTGMEHAFEHSDDLAESAGLARGTAGGAARPARC